MNKSPSNDPQPCEIPLRAQLYKYRLTHVELAVLRAMLEGNSSGQFTFYTIGRIAAYAKLSVRAVQNCINGTPAYRRKDGTITKPRPGLIQKRILVPIAPYNAAKRRPTTYRIQIEALVPDPRVERYLDILRCG